MQNGGQGISWPPQILKIVFTSDFSSGHCCMARFKSALRKIRPASRDFGCSRERPSPAAKDASLMRFSKAGCCGWPFRDCPLALTDYALLIVEFASNMAAARLRIRTVLREDETFGCFSPIAASYSVRRPRRKREVESRRYNRRLKRPRGLIADDLSTAHRLPFGVPLQ